MAAPTNRRCIIGDRRRHRPRYLKPKKDGLYDLLALWNHSVGGWVACRTALRASDKIASYRLRSSDSGGPRHPFAGTLRGAHSLS